MYIVCPSDRDFSTKACEAPSRFSHGQTLTGVENQGIVTSDIRGQGSECLNKDRIIKCMVSALCRVQRHIFSPIGDLWSPEKVRTGDGRGRRKHHIARPEQRRGYRWQCGREAAWTHSIGGSKDSQGLSREQQGQELGSVLLSNAQ
jgi:hypothetical protein